MKHRAKDLKYIYAAPSATVNLSHHSLNTKQEKALPVISQTKHSWSSFFQWANYVAQLDSLLISLTNDIEHSGTILKWMVFQFIRLYFMITPQVTFQNGVSFLYHTPLR